MTKKDTAAKKGLIRLFKLWAETQDEALRDALLNVFLSEQEKQSLNDRYWILKALLQSDQSQRTIAKELQVSIAKITRGSNELKRIEPALLAYLKEKL